MGAILLNGAHIGTGSIVAAGTLVIEEHEGAAAVAGDGQSREGEAAADGRRNRRAFRRYADRYVGYRLDYMGRWADWQRWAVWLDVMADGRCQEWQRERRAVGHGDRHVHKATGRNPRFSSRRHPPARVRHRCRSRRLRAVRLRAARDAGVREHRDAARQVRRRRQQAHFQDSAARRARGAAAKPISRCATT